MSRVKRQKGQAINFVVGGLKKLMSDEKVEGRIRLAACVWLMYVDKLIPDHPPMSEDKQKRNPIDLPLGLLRDTEKTLPSTPEPEISDTMLQNLRDQFKEEENATNSSNE